MNVQQLKNERWDAADQAPAAQRKELVKLGVRAKVTTYQIIPGGAAKEITP